MTDPSLCALCPRLCRYACPVAQGTADEGATPTSMAQAWRAAKAGDLPWKAAADVLSRCTGCMACKAPCELEQDVPSYLYEARAEAWTNGAVPDGAALMHRRYLDSGNPFGADLTSSLREHGDDDDFERKGRVLFWPGCRSLHEQPDLVAGLMPIFRALGADHVSLPARKETPCCGAPLRAIGDDAGFQVAIAANQQYFNRQRTWITPSGECLNAVREGYPSTGNAITAEVLHLSEFLLFFAEQLADLGHAAYVHRAENGLPAPQVVVFDSCGVGRRAGRGDAIYGVLEAALGSAPPSFAPSPGRTVCCGAGDFHDLRRPDAAAQTADWAAAQGVAPPGSWLVTTDAGCMGSLRGRLPGVEVYDLVGFLVAWLGPVVTTGAKASTPAPSGLKANG
ncbi:MAG: (Fe-S)-binding protein [Deltaproteobacteria bacterium]|nr:(Fe-S)-binding protein [Deltaproteobacteria bacterium]